MKTRKKSRVAAKNVAKMIVEAVRDGMKDMDPEEQERRLKSFCDDVGGRLRRRARTSGSGHVASSRMAARGHG